MSHEAAELLRRATEARARADAAVAYERDRRKRLERSRAEVELGATRGRRALGRLTGSRLWDTFARRLSPRSRDDFPARASEAERARHDDALARREKLRRENDRLERRLRTLEHGADEVRRAATSALAMHGSALPRPPAVGAVSLRLPPAAGLQHVTVVVGGPRRRALPIALRALRERPRRLVLARGHAAGFGPEVASTIAASRAEFVVVCGPGLGRPPAGWLAELAGELKRSPGLGALAAPAGAWTFEWTGFAPEPRPARTAAQLPAAVGGSCVALRRAALDGMAPCGEYHGAAWALDLSLELRARGVAVGVSTEPLLGASPPLPAGDVALLHRRWGPALRRAILGDLLAGGGGWCARPLRVDGLQPSALKALGWHSAQGDADVVIGAGETGMTVDWTPGRPGAPAYTDLGPSATPAELRDALAQTLEASSFTVRVGAPGWDSARAGGDLPLAEALCCALARRGHHTAIEVAGEDDAGAVRSLDVLVNVRGRRAARPAPGQLNTLWLLSHPGDVSDAELSEHDLALVASAQHAARLRSRVDTPVATLLQFTDPGRFFPDRDDDRRHELLFVGNWRSKLRPIVWDAVQAGFEPALYGRGWEHVFPKLLVAEHVPQSDLRRLYSSCAVLLCDHWEDMRAAGFVSNRVFDALACGAFVVSDRCEGLEELLGDTVVTYGDPEDLRAVLERFLADPGERRSRSERGRALVLERHTADRRAAELMDALALARRTARQLPPR